VIRYAMVTVVSVWLGSLPIRFMPRLSFNSATLKITSPLAIATLWALGLVTPSVAQTPSQPSTPVPSPISTPPASPTSTPPAEQPNVVQPTGPAPTILSTTGGQKLMGEASSAVSSQNYTVAVQKLQQAREVFNQLSNFYQELAGGFSGVDNRVADAHRKKALESAQLRDQASYQLALVHRAQNKPELAIPLLVQIIRSQQPTRDLGQKSYQQLYELGFVDSPYPTAGSPTPTPTPKEKKKR
jgi:hypothetical protein